LEILVLIAVGVVSGVLAGLLGIGGGLVIVPSLAALLVTRGVAADIAMPMAVATALGSMLLTSLSSAISHARHDNVDWSVVIRLGPAVALGGAGGATLAAALPGLVLARIFALLAGAIALRMLLGARSPSPGSVDARTPRPRGWWMFGPVAGALSAMIGIGGGSFNVPYLVHNGYSTLRAVGIAAACGWPIALGGSLAFIVEGRDEIGVPGALGYWYLPGVVVIGIVGSLAAPLGARLARRIGSDALKRAFGLFLLLVAVRMAWG